MGSETGRSAYGPAVARPSRRKAVARRVYLGLIAALLVIGLGSVARAQDPPPQVLDENQQATVERAQGDPGEACQEQVNQSQAAGTVNSPPVSGAGCDNQYTPVAKDGNGIGWSQIAGQMHKSLSDPPAYNQTIQNNPERGLAIPPTVDFYTVSFANPSRGFAGGAQCREDAPERPWDAENDRYTQSNAAYQEEITNFLNTCMRVPVIYRYTDFSEKGPIWELAYKGSTPGFVGAITWLYNLDVKEHGLRAIAVGGTGSPGPDCPKSESDPPYPDPANPAKPAHCGGYPRREPAIPPQVASNCRDKATPPADSSPPTPDAIQAKIVACEDEWRKRHDPAGTGLAWEFTDGDWHDRDVPRSMRGMTAADATPDTRNCPGASTACAMVGGLQQIWQWKDDGFDPMPWRPDPTADAPSKKVTYTRGTNAPNCTSAWQCRWLYRVRAIQFSTAESGGAIAVTAGCCTESPDPDAGNARTISFDRDTSRWNVLSAGFACSGNTCAGHARLPDSLYAVAITNTITGSVLASPGGPERANEPPSQILDSGGGPESATRPWLSPVRLVAAGGNAQADRRAFTENVIGSAMGARPQANDYTLDWAVGGFRHGERDRAAAYTTIPQVYSTDGAVVGPYLRAHPGVVPDPVNCPDETLNGIGSNPNNIPDCVPNEKFAEQTRSSYLFKLSSFFLNGFAATDDGVRWGVGDRGAIQRFGNNAGSGRTERPESAPKLGAKRHTPGPGKGPYESTRPELSDSPGTVPPRSSLALEKDEGCPEQESPSAGVLSCPRFSSYGAPNPNAQDLGGEGVRQIVMSRDGSEGWAVGPFSSDPFAGATTIHRFDGTRWARCGTETLEGAFEADPACEALRPLRQHGSGVKFTAAARIPMEYGSDPAKFDDFEVIAAGTTDATGRRPIIRYSDGQWDIHEQLTASLNEGSDSGEVTGLAFASSSDGWVITDSGSSNSGVGLYRYDGDQLVHCGVRLGAPSYGVPGQVDRPACEDLNGLIPAMEDFDYVRRMHLASAGERIYLYGNRVGSGNRRYPMVLYRDPGPCDKKGDSGCWQQAYDPGCARQEQDPRDPGRVSCLADNDPGKVGEIYSLSVALGADGSYNGWGLGSFGADTFRGGSGSVRDIKVEQSPTETPFIHSDVKGEVWEPVLAGGPADDYLLRSKTTLENKEPEPSQAQVVALPGPKGEGGVIATPNRANVVRAWQPGVWLNPTDDKWRVLPAPYVSPWGPDVTTQGTIQSLAADGVGGFWVATSQVYGKGESTFYRFSDYTAPEVFTEVGNPVREEITAATGGDDGSFWVTTNTDILYRYDRQTGWDRMRISGWDPGRVPTNPSAATAIAIGPDGNGVVVGKAGRIADVGPGGTILNPAAGVLCSKNENRAPCGTGRTLRAAAIAPGGSAMIGGESRSVLYREGASGEFHATTPPPTALYATITGISMPSEQEVWLTTNLGEIYKGTLGEERWAWKREDTDEFGNSISRSEHSRKQGEPLRAIAMDRSGHGYAVGDHGVMMERTGSESSPWRRVETSYLDNFTAVTLGPSGRGVLIGGEAGIILTGEGGELHPSRFSDRFDPTNWGYTNQVSRIAGLALIGGPRDGQVEAWVASQTWNDPSGNRSPAPNNILHFSNDPSEPLLDGAARGTTALADAPTASTGSLTFAAFGNSNCLSGGDPVGRSCPELTGSNTATDLTAHKIRNELLRARQKGMVQFSLFTGDVGERPGIREKVPLEGPSDRGRVHDRWRELIADPLIEGDMPLFGAIGGRDLAVAYSGSENPSYAASTHETRAGLSLPWRQAMASMAAPWGTLGSSQARTKDGLSFVPVDTGGTKVEPGDTPLEDPTEPLGGTTVEDPTEPISGKEVTDATGSPTRTPGSRDGFFGDVTLPRRGVVGDRKIPTGGAHTHYALDIVRGENKLLRLVVLDTSLRSLAASNANQNPVEDQLGWLREALKRPDHQRAIVLTNTPTYSYGPGTNGETLVEGTVLEAILMENKVDLVVNGRLGWNALYYALAPGIHSPCPGATYQPSPPQGIPDCHGSAPSEANKAVESAQKSVAEISGNDTSRVLPFLVSHTAGGKFGPEGHGPDMGAANGAWRGYSVVHLDPKSGDIQIEQRPIFDWIAIRVPPGESATHALRPRQRLKLEGFGREVLGIDVGPRFDEITSPAITHCYDLVYADPEKPWLPLKAEDADEELLASQGEGCTNRTPSSTTASSSTLAADSSPDDSEAAGPCEPYVCLASNIGTIQQDGQVRAGSGEQERTYAMAVLSVNRKVATYPLAFEPRPSFSQPRVPPPPPPPPPAPPAPPATPPVGTVGNLSLPTPPALPSLPLGAELVPPAPPILPPPPGAANVAPLNLFLSTPGINIAPQSTVIPPPAPPIQPAPPGGARKEARQRQAAAQKSGSEVSDESGDGAGDLADSPRQAEGAQMSRLDNSFSRRSEEAAQAAPLHRHQPSAWIRNLQWGGGMTLMALVLAFGWMTVRPTPRRRPPHVPAPAWSRADYRRRRR